MIHFVFNNLVKNSRKIIKFIELINLNEKRANFYLKDKSNSRHKVIYALILPIKLQLLYDQT